MFYGKVIILSWNMQLAADPYDFGLAILQPTLIHHNSSIMCYACIRNDI